MVALIVFALIVIIVVLIVLSSNKESENIELLQKTYRTDIYDKYKRNSTKQLNEILSDIQDNYKKKLKHYCDLYEEDYGSECMTHFGKNEDKIINGGETYMRNDKKAMQLYYTYNIIIEILEKRNK